MRLEGPAGPEFVLGVLNLLAIAHVVVAEAFAFTDGLDSGYCRVIEVHRDVGAHRVAAA